MNSNANDVYKIFTRVKYITIFITITIFTCVYWYIQLFWTYFKYLDDFHKFLKVYETLKYKTKYSRNYN